MAGLYETGSQIYTVDPQIDALARAARAEIDQEKRKAIFSQIFKLNKEKGIYILLYNEVQAYGVKDGLNWKPRPDGFVRFHEIAR
jgi:ABC-type transport system substrate-binding protein